MTRPICLLLASDTHCGSTIGLCPPEGVRTDDGQEILPSKVQLWLWDCWVKVHQQYDAIARDLKAERWGVLNGDLVDGDHHGTAQIMSRHPDAQAYIARTTFEMTKSLKLKRLFVVRGTEVHTGTSGSAEESLAHHLNAERDPETHLWSRWHLRLRVHGRLFDVQHHGKGLGRLPHTKQNGANSLAWRVWQTHAERGLEAPALAVRSHLHQYADSFGANRMTRGLFLPSFQVKTSFVHRIAADEIADVGAAVATVYPDGRIEVTPILFQPDLPGEV